MQHAFETMQALAEDADFLGLHDLAEVYQASADRLFEEGLGKLIVDGKVIATVRNVDIRFNKLPKPPHHDDKFGSGK